MNNYVEIINKILSLGIIFLQIIIVILTINLVFSRRPNNKFLLFFKSNTFIFGFLVSLSAIIASLFYSEIIGYPPCELCWVQRLFIYPQLILFAIGFYKKDNFVINFSLIFAILGSLISLYHIYIENGGSSSLSCASIGTSSAHTISCATRYIYEFNYMTMPIMALTVSLFLLILIFNYKYIVKK